MAGILSLVATPIGNLEDLSPRGIRTLKEVDLIAAEDTRNSRKLLNYFAITTPMTSYHEYNRIEKARILIEKLQEGKDIALITDAGTPGISDPGEDLVRMCQEQGIQVTSIPGPAACITALTLSGLSTRRFSFEGFLPADKRERKELLEELSEEMRTIILYEAPHRLKKTLALLLETLGDRKVALVREITKKHETVQRLTLQEAVVYYREQEPRGEYVLVIQGRDFKERRRQNQEEWQKIPLKEHMSRYLDQGFEKKEAMKLVAKDRGVGKREIYQALLEMEEHKM